MQFSLSLAVRADYKWGEFEGHQVCGHALRQRLVLCTRCLEYGMRGGRYAAVCTTFFAGHPCALNCGPGPLLQWALGPAGTADTSSLSWYGSEGFYKDASIAPGWAPSSCTEEQRNDFYQQRECFQCGPESSDSTDNFSGCVKTDALTSVTSTQSFYVKFGVTKQSNGANVVPCEQYALRFSVYSLSLQDILNCHDVLAVQNACSVLF